MSPDILVFLNIFYWRNLGFSYDMIGKKKRQSMPIRNAKKMCVQFNINKQIQKNTYKNFEVEPYQK